jgi:hypothetical protein
MTTTVTGSHTSSLQRINPIGRAPLCPELDPTHAVGIGILAKGGRTTDPIVAERQGLILETLEDAQEFLQLAKEHRDRSAQPQVSAPPADQPTPTTQSRDSADLKRAEPVGPATYRPELDPTHAIGRGILSRANRTTDAARAERLGWILLSRQEARVFLELSYEYKQRRELEKAQSAAVGRSFQKTERKPRRRGRPSKVSELPGIYGNRTLDRWLKHAGLTRTEQAIARKVLSILRAEHLATGRGKFICRASLGSDRTVKRTFSKLRAAHLITESRPVKGQNQTRLTNLGPVFLGGLTGQLDGPKLAPQNPNFDTPKPLANTGEVASVLAPRFSNPLREGSYGAGPAASAPLRATASEPPQSPHHIKQIQIQSNTTTQTPMTDQQKPAALDYGSVITVKGHDGHYVVKGLSWGDTPDSDSVRCVSLDNPDKWLTSKMTDVEVVG